jgi:hypothetical protein
MRFLALCAFASLWIDPAAFAADEFQDFETWPQTGSWGTTVFESWTLSDGQVKQNRGGFGPPIDLQCGWLHDFEDSATSWLESPVYAAGVMSVSFWVRRDISSGGSSTAVLQTSNNQVDWIDHQAFSITNFNWTQLTFVFDSFDPTYLRVRKTGDTGVNAYAGLDDIEVVPRAPVFFTNLRHSPGLPTMEENVDILVDAAIQQSLNGVVFSTFYRFEANDPFTSLPMALEAGTTYGTTIPIPPGAGWDRTVEYYVQAAFDLGGPQLIFSPAAGSNAPAFYAPTVVVKGAPPRQLTPSSQRTPFIISEIMYHPSDALDTNSLEFIEIFNTDPLPRDIGGFRISGDADYTFPPGTTIGSRAFIVAARNPAALQQAYGLGQVYGPYTNNLPNRGGTVRFRNDFGAVLLEVNYDDQMPWPVAADGSGHSLVMARPDFGEGSVRAWDTSAFVGGSPGESDPLPEDALRNIVINEFLAHTDLPDVDYIELYNRGTQSTDISGCALTDTPATKKFMIPPATILQPGEYIVFDQTNQLGFSLSSGGDDIYLWSPDCSNVIDAVRFDAQVNGVASGRFPDGAASFHALNMQTPGIANGSADLLIQDVVINEIMYAPLSGKVRDEYVELYNRGTNAVDLSYWRFVDGIDYLFPVGTVIPANGYLVIAEDAQHLRTNYAQLNTANTLGNYAGILSDRGERLALAKPDDLGLPFQDLVIVDEVTYSDGNRWGKWTDGGGSSLELVDPHSDNRHAMNWLGSDETAKSDWVTIEYTGRVEHGSPQTPASHPWDLNVFIPHAGECLVDDVEVFRTDGGNMNNRINDPGFDTGLSEWKPAGTHIESSFNAAEGFDSPGCLHLRASGSGTVRGWAFFGTSTEPNHVNRRFNGMWAIPGETFTVRAKARWLAGWPVCVLGMSGYWHEAASMLDVSADLGSPGLQNSRFSGNTGPAISDLKHRPILPVGGQSIVVTCRAHDPDGLASLSLEYRIDPSTNYQTMAMLDDGSGGDALAGDGIYSAQIPGQGVGTIAAFRVKAVDGHASPATSWFPSDDLFQDALVRFGEPVPKGLFGTYMCWLSSTNATTLQNRLARSNHPLDMTFAYGQHRVIYNAGIRYRGNGRGSGDYRVAAYSCGVPKSERFLGINEFKIDRIAEPQHTTLLTEQHAYWTARKIGMAAGQLSYIRARVNGSDLVRHQFQIATRDFCTSWYEDDDPFVHKNVAGDPFTEYTRSDGMKAKANYRYQAQKKKTKVPSDSYDTLYNIVDAWQTLDNEVFDARMAALIDPYGWAAYSAVNRVVGNADSYGWTIFHNMFFYASPTHRSRLHLHDMDQAYDMNHWNESDPSLFPQSLLPSILTRLFNDRPLFRRAYWRVLKNLSDGPLRPDVHVPELLGWYDALFTNGIPATHPQPVIDFIADRQAKVTSELWVAPFEITSSGGSDFSTGSSIVTLDGSAPIEVASFLINGRAQRVTYPAESIWRAQFGIANGPNALVVEGFDRDGNAVAIDSITVTLTTAAPSPIDQLIISEIMYHPSARQAEYVEIFNRSAFTFDLGGWRLNGVDHIFDGGALIGPGERRVVAENVTAYQHTFGNAEVVIGDYAGNLDNGGETLSLQMPIGSNVWLTINKVRFDDGGAWPAGADGTGAALQLIDLNADNSRAGNWGVVPAPAMSSYTPGSANSNADTLFTFPLLWINEIMPSNTSTIVDNHGEFEPWVELFNADINTIDLSSYRLSNDYEDPDGWPFPAGTTIPPGSRLLVWADGEANETDTAFPHTDFRLNSVSGAVVLARQWLGSPVVIDYLDYDSIGENVSFGSLPEGDPFSRGIFPTPTPGTANSGASAPVQIVINEWMSDNETTITDPADDYNDDWFELYNPTASNADLTGYTLTDNLAVTNKFAIPSGTIVPAGGFLLVWADNDTDQNGPGVDLHVNFGLSKNGDSIGLYAPSGSLVDSAAFGPQGDDHSYGSWPDGADATFTMSPPTPAGSNSVYVVFMIDVSATSSDVYRVDANNDLLGTNWIVLDIFTAVNGVVTFADSNAVAMPWRFYRLRDDIVP